MKRKIYIEMEAGDSIWDVFPWLKKLVDASFVDVEIKGEFRI